MSEKVKIVLIDDDLDYCVYIKEKLEASGDFEVTTSSTPEKAEEVIRQVLPCLILLDIVMPTRKGTDIIAALKKTDDLKRIPIIVVSGKGEMVFNKKKHDFQWTPNSKIVQNRGPLPDARNAEALAEAYKVNDYLAKPFAVDVLIQIMQDVLAKAKKVAAKQEDIGQV